MKKYIIALVAVLVVVSCSDYKYPEDKTVSEKNGARADSTISYLPDTVKFSGVDYVFDWNADRRAAIDDYYGFTSEALLYNYYQGRSIYRFLFAKKGCAPLIVSVNNDGTRSWVISKMIYEKEEIAPACGVILVKEFKNHTRDLSEDEIKEFDVQLKNVDFFQLETKEANNNLENYCLIEGHEDGKYWVIYRSLDDAQLQPLTDFVAKLSRFDYNAERVSKLPEMSMP